MKSLFNFLKKHYIKIALSLLIPPFIFLGIKILFDPDWFFRPYRLYKLTISEAFFLLVTFLFFSAIYLIYKNDFNNFWRRYKNTFTLDFPYFTFVDFIGLFLLSSFTIFYILNYHYFTEDFLYHKFLTLLILILFYLVLSHGLNSTPNNFYSPPDPRHILADDPIEFEDEDKLDRKFFAKNLCEEIDSLSPTLTKGAYVYGLFGPWGEGKTSVLNLINNYFSSKNEYLVIPFQPWYYGNKESILKAFYQEIETTFCRHYILPGLKWAFNKYKSLIFSSLSNAGFTLSTQQSNETILEIKSRIEAYLKKTNRKLLILIDDIDRLPAEEMELIFKLVHLNLNFKKTIFILSFDHEVVSRALVKTWETTGDWDQSQIKLTHKKPGHV